MKLNQGILDEWFVSEEEADEVAEGGGISVRHNNESKLEARQLQEFGWAQQQIAETLKVPRRTVSFWLGNIAKPVASDIAKAHLNGNNGTSGLATSITLYRAKYEEAGGKIPLESIDLILTDPPYLASSNNLSRTLQKTDLRRVCGQPFKDYYLPEEKRVCTRCLRG